MDDRVAIRIDAFEFEKKPVEEKYTVTLDKYECWMVEHIIEDWLGVEKAGAGWKRENNLLKLRQKIGAQVAFAKLSNCYMALDRRYMQYDLLLTLHLPKRCLESTVDVKCTGHQNGMLCADLETKFRGVCDLYALMFGLYPTYTFKGCILGEQFIKDENIKTVFGKRVYAIDQKALSMNFYF
jgi:hypothetical protein